MLKTILVATDGSESAEKATELAANLAMTYEAKLVLLHVWQEKILPDAKSHPAEAEQVDQGARTGALTSLAEAQKHPCPSASSEKNSDDDWHNPEAICNSLLYKAKCSAQEFGAEKIETVLMKGEPVTEIMRYAEYEKADLIVMGSRGLNQLKRLLLGSVSHKLTERAPCPTLTVK